MTYVTLKMDHWSRIIKKFDISDELFEYLFKFAMLDDTSSVGGYDWNKDTLYLNRSKALDDVIKKHCKAPKDYELLDNIETARLGESIEIAPMQFKYEYIKEVVKVDYGKGTCTVEKSTPNKEAYREIPTYEVSLSDRCVFEGVKKKDKVLIRKFLNDEFLAVKVVEKYHKPTDEEMKKELQYFNDIIGGY